MSCKRLCVYVGEALAAYGFGEGHPFGPDRMDAFWQRMLERGLDKLIQVCEGTLSRLLSRGHGTPKKGG